MVGAEIIDPGGERRRRAEHGGIAVEHLEVFAVRAFERRQDLGIILVGRARAEDRQPGADPFLEIGDHAAQMMGQDLDVGIAVEQPP